MTPQYTNAPLESAEGVEVGDVVRFNGASVFQVEGFDIRLKTIRDQSRDVKISDCVWLGRPDADGWIEWRGGENPVGDELVQILLSRQDHGGPSLPAEKWAWSKGAGITSYRLVHPDGAPRFVNAPAVQPVAEPAPQPVDWRELKAGDEVEMTVRGVVTSKCEERHLQIKLQPAGPDVFDSCFFANELDAATIRRVPPPVKPWAVGDLAVFDLGHGFIETTIIELIHAGRAYYLADTGEGLYPAGGVELSALRRV